MTYHKWVRAEEDILRSVSTPNNWLPNREIHEKYLPDISMISISSKRKSLELYNPIQKSKKSIWTKKDIEILLRYSQPDNWIIASQIHKKYLPYIRIKQINYKRTTLGLKTPDYLDKRRERRDIWTEEEDNILREFSTPQNWLSAGEIIHRSILNHSFSSINIRRVILDLKKPLKELKEYNLICNKCGNTFINKNKDRKRCTNCWTLREKGSKKKIKIETLHDYIERKYSSILSEYNSMISAVAYNPERPRDIPEGHKWCSSCKSIKPLDEFYKNKVMINGHDNYCKECKYKYHGKYRPVRRNGRWADIMIDKDHKLCAKCKFVKPIVEFYRDNHSKNGYCSYCISCINGRKPDSDERNRDSNDRNGYQCSGCGEWFSRYHIDLHEPICLKLI